MRAIDPTATLAVQCGNGFDAGFSPLSKYSFEPIQCCPLSLGADMRRREFITLLGGEAAAWPLAARAQQADRIPRIGVLIGLLESDSEGQARLEAFRNGLQELGWLESRNIRIDYRWAGDDAARLQVYAAELVSLKPDVIFAASGTPLAALHRETRTIPIVFANSNDPVSDGFVASWVRPGGNIS